ncbi:MAG: hypothetical protein ACYSTG_10285 [Planctomycetota bacterium]|jgi:hypothetical protein
MSDDITSFEVSVRTGKRKGLWNLSFEPDVLTLTSADGGESHQITKSEAAEKIEAPAPLSGGKALAAHIPKREMFWLEPEQMDVVKQWLGPPGLPELKVALKRRFKWCLPIGIFFVLTSLPLPANPEAGVEAVPFDVIGAVLGITLIGLSLAMRLWPRRELFLIDSLWFMVLSAKVVYDIVAGSSWLWCIFVAWIVLMVLGGVNQYRRFASI